MADRKKTGKKRGKDKNNTGPAPTKEEKAVATHLRFNCPTKSTMVAGDEVHYFTASKAIDCLLESKWAAGKAKGDALFTNRSSCVAYIQILMEKGMIWRARKLVPRRKERDVVKKTKQAGEGDGGDAAKSTPKKKRKTEKNEEEASVSTTKDEEKTENDTGKQKDNNDDSDTNKADDEKKKKKKIKLEFHPDQIFRDGPDVYVWHFDPVSWTKFFIGLGLGSWVRIPCSVIGAIVVCLFPLWPPWLRLGVYYLSLVAMGFVGFLLFLIVLRGIIFACVWVCTMGRHHFWFLPNLTEDCGFFESFQPLYSYAYYGDETEKADKEKRSDKEDSDDEEKEEREENAGEEEQATDTDRRGSSDDEQEEVHEEGGNGDNVEESSSAGGTPRTEKPRKRNVPIKQDGNDTNGFEIVD